MSKYQSHQVFHCSTLLKPQQEPPIRMLIRLPATGETTVKTFSIKYPSLLAFACVAIFASINAHAATFTTTTSGVYDEQVYETNQVDDVATGSVTLPTFKTRISNAFSAGLGGVINFDDGTGTDFTQIDASYDSGNKTLTILVPGTDPPPTSGTPDFTTVDGSSQGRTPISGSASFDHWISKSGGNTDRYAFDFNAADQVDAVGITVLSRNSTTFNAVATVTFDDNSTSQLTDTIDPGGAAHDTFFGFEAPSGRVITQLEVTGISGAGVDDLAFTIVPEPASLALLGAGTLLLLGRRR